MIRSTISTRLFDVADTVTRHTGGGGHGERDDAAGVRGGPGGVDRRGDLVARGTRGLGHLRALRRDELSETHALLDRASRGRCIPRQPTQKWPLPLDLTPSLLREVEW